MRRTDFRRSFGQLRFSPRPEEQHASFAKYSFTGKRRLRHRCQACRQSWRRSCTARSTPTIRAATRGPSPNTRGTTSCCPNDFVINPGTIVPARRVQLPEPAHAVLTRPAAEGVRSCVAAYGTLYDGHKTEAGYTGRIGVIPAVRARAEHRAQLGPAALRRLLGARHRLARHPHAQPANGREQPHPIQRRLAHPELQRSLQVGVPGPAAKYSSCTATAGTRSPRATRSS